MFYTKIHNGSYSGIKTPWIQPHNTDPRGRRPGVQHTRRERKFTDNHQVTAGHHGGEA